ncbi:MAG TPA: nucleotidyltransferase domain-containing protein [Candidatus Hydrogenedentes bacterium]|nr:nucleotidyltransferase domain-containing protein [Candidatus Hydrogenedentota bacterium]
MNGDIADAAAKALLDAAPRGSRVILFGSCARGTARPDSDLDFLVVEPAIKDRFAEIFRLRKAVEAVFGDDVQPVDLVVTDEAQFRRCEGIPNTLAFEAATGGRVYG